MSWDFFKITYPHAAKEYRCDEAGCLIAKGERHAYNAGKVDGDFMDYRLCMTCADLASAWCEIINEEGWSLGDLRGELTEEGWPPEKHGALLEMARVSRENRARRNLHYRIASQALNSVEAERKRQIEVCGYDAAHDDHHTGGEIALAAAGYITPPEIAHFLFDDSPVWTWLRNKASHDRRQQLVIGAALCLAEIERLDRATPAVTND